MLFPCSANYFLLLGLLLLGSNFVPPAAGVFLIRDRRNGGFSLLILRPVWGIGD